MALSSIFDYAALREVLAFASAGVWSLVIIAAIAYLFLFNRFLSFLRKEHPDEWKRLGSPTFFMNNSIANNRAVLRFLRKREYLPTNDPELKRRSILIWKFLKGYLVLFIVALSIGLAFIFSSWE